MFVSVSKGELLQVQVNKILYKAHNQYSFSVGIKGDQRHREIAARRRNIFRRQNSGICLKSISEYNPEMKVMHSLIGESVVPSTPQTRKGNTILCLDGGGLKVKNLAP